MPTILGISAESGTRPRTSRARETRVEAANVFRHRIVDDSTARGVSTCAPRARTTDLRPERRQCSSRSRDDRSLRIMKVHFIAIALMGLVLGAQAGAVDLTAKNFDAEVLESGKSAFVKFLAPWYVPDARHARRSEKRDRAAASFLRFPRRHLRARGCFFRRFFSSFAEEGDVEPPAGLPPRPQKRASFADPRDPTPTPLRSKPQVRPLQVDEAGLGQTR